ncbi:MAG: TetR/AcrR family transcriptional regulator [Solirubrobacteraceae bacterium]|nr:TetR/AcrR family transcriptional regulator [Solirubrobacteraceae bacterium]
MTVPRGRHAPPLEVRLGVQRQRLFEAAARVFSQVGFAEASAESISREAGMSKATFYEHFANKEECILALVDAAAVIVQEAVTQKAHDIHERVSTFLQVVARHPGLARVVMVDVIGVGPIGASKRDEMLQTFGDFLVAENQRAHESYGAPLFASPDDAYAIVGAIMELASRQLRTGHPADIRDLEPVIERVVAGVLEQGKR